VYFPPPFLLAGNITCDRGTPDEAQVSGILNAEDQLVFGVRATSGPLLLLLDVRLFCDMGLKTTQL
jgi:hypothetical protein